MNIHCHTNLDLHYAEKWPCLLPCRPMKGDLITSSTGLELEVCRIKFKEDEEGTESRTEDGGYHYDQPEVRCFVELMLPPNRYGGSHTEFEKWYKKRKY